MFQQLKASKVNATSEGNLKLDPTSVSEDSTMESYPVEAAIENLEKILLDIEQKEHKYYWHI